MADEYIRKADAIRWVKTECNPYGRPTLDYESGIRVMVHLKHMPPADVAPVVHGKWIDEDPAFAEYFANCSVCGYEIDVHNERGYFNFCPNCGAKMDARREEEA